MSTSPLEVTLFLVTGGLAIEITRKEAVTVRAVLRQEEQVEDGYGIALAGCVEGWDCPDDLDVTSYFWVSFATPFAVVAVLPAGIPLVGRSTDVQHRRFEYE